MRLQSLLSSKSRRSTSGGDDLTSSCTPEFNAQRTAVSAGLNSTTQASLPPQHHRRRISCGGGESDSDCGAGCKSNSCPVNDSGVEIQPSERSEGSPRLELPSFTAIEVPESWCGVEPDSTTPTSSESNGAPRDEKDALIEDLANHVANLERKLRYVEEDNYRLRRAFAQQFDQRDTVWEFCCQEEHGDDLPGDEEYGIEESSSHVSSDASPQPPFRDRAKTLEPTPSDMAERFSISKRLRCHSLPLPPRSSMFATAFHEDELTPGEVETDDQYQHSPPPDVIFESLLETPCSPDISTRPRESRPKIPRPRRSAYDSVDRCFTCAFVHEHCKYMSRLEFLGRSMYYGFYIPGHFDSFIESAAEEEPDPQDIAVQDESETGPPEGAQAMQTVGSEDVTSRSEDRALEFLDACTPPDDEEMHQEVEEFEESGWSPVSRTQEQGSPDVDNQYPVNEATRRILLRDPCLATLFPIVEEQLEEEEDGEQFVPTEPVYKGPTAARKKRFYAFGNLANSLEPIAEHDDFASVEHQGSAQSSCHEHERGLFTSSTRGSGRSSAGTVIDEDGDTISSVNTGNSSGDDVAPVRETSSQVNTVPFPIERTEMSWWLMMEEDLKAGDVVL